MPKSDCIFAYLYLLSVTLVLSSCSSAVSGGARSNSASVKTSSAEFQALARSVCQTINTSQGIQETVTAVNDATTKMSVKSTKQYSVTGAEFRGNALRFTLHIVETAVQSSGAKIKTIEYKTYDIPLREIKSITAGPSSRSQKLLVADDNTSAVINTKLSYQVAIWQFPSASSGYWAKKWDMYSDIAGEMTLLPIKGPTRADAAWLMNFSDEQTAQGVAEDLRRLVEMATGKKPDQYWEAH